MTPPGQRSLPTVTTPSTTGAAHPALVQTVWMRVFMDSLRRAGVAAVVVSPGSRSTPLVFAAQAVGLSCHTIIDERSAGFFALGWAKITGTPVALLCTSGTAGAHYYPALIEASQSFAPLIVITADRPAELRDCAAPQTIDQTKLFGNHVRHFADLGAAHEGTMSLRALRRKAVQSVQRTRTPIPGPVHINVPARKPLEPRRPETPADIAVVQRGDEILAETAPRMMTGIPRAAAQSVAAFADACAATERGIIALGPMPPVDPAWSRQPQRLRQALARLAHITGFPLLAEASSQMRFADLPVCDGFDILLSAPGFRATSRPTLIIQIGAPPTSMGWAAYLGENPDCVHCVINPWGWNDPHNSADALITADPLDTLQRLGECIAARMGQRPEDGPSAQPPASISRPHGRTGLWAERFAAGNQLVWQAVAQVLDRDTAPPLETEPHKPVDTEPRIGDDAMHEGEAMSAVVAALPHSAVLALGNSLPIRTVDTYCRTRERDWAVLSQRGANGIDGLISSAAGAARAARRPTALILGDVSFVHDLGGLAAARLRWRDAPLAIVVIDNQGGRIFEQLPIAQHAGDLWDAHWLTSPGYDLRAAAAVFGHGYVHAETPSALSRAVADAVQPGAGCTIIHASVAPHSAAVDRNRIIAAVDAGVADLPTLPGDDPGDD